MRRAIRSDEPSNGALAGVLRERRRANPASLISNEIIARELDDFLRRTFPRPAETVLDLGAGTRPYAPLYVGHFSRSVSVDVEHSPHDTERVDVIASAEDLPFPADSFDCVICTEVLEHCADPWAAGAEIGRVLRPGGWAFVTTPFLCALHETPHDYHRFTPWGIIELASRSHLEVISVRPRGDYAAVAMLDLLWPVGKFWYSLSKTSGWDLYNASNPLVWLTTIAPQRAYLWLWLRIRRIGNSRIKSFFERLSRHTLGYVAILRRPPGERA